MHPPPLPKWSLRVQIKSENQARRLYFTEVLAYARTSITGGNKHILLKPFI
jgi:hypothetical protein